MNRDDDVFLVDEEDSPTVPYFGGCPECRTHDGYVNVGKDHWIVCEKCKVKWHVGSGLFSSWEQETETDWARNRELLAGFRQVEPVRPDIAA